ncbi:MAG: DHH family phosphoesterase [Hadesarchaea archaeon]|nr:DHH family phosphoesterase [Hadesarchaea archaeon]
MKELESFLSDNSGKGKRVLIIGHPHADPDAVGSVKALEEILEKLDFRVDAGVPKGLDRLASEVLSSFNSEINLNPPVKAEITIVVDTSSLDQLEEYERKIEESGTKIIFIDHHRLNLATKRAADIYWVDESTSSTAELVLKLAEKLGIDFTQKTASLLLAGIITDTGHFRFANEDTFQAVSNLLRMNADYNETLDAVQVPEDPSKRIAMLKAVQRSELKKSQDRWIVFSKIGAFESDAASLFVKIGADVALAGGKKNNGEIRISARSRSGVASETHLHLGELMSTISEEFGGTGGGHAGAAAMTIEGELSEVKEAIFRELKKMLEPK